PKLMRPFGDLFLQTQVLVHVKNRPAFLVVLRLFHKFFFGCHRSLFIGSWLRDSGALEELCPVLGREFFGLGRKRLLSSLVQRRCRRGPRRDRDPDLHEEVLLTGRRTETQQPDGLARTVMKLVRSVRGDIYRIARTDNGLVAAECYIKLAFE